MKKSHFCFLLILIFLFTCYVVFIQTKFVSYQGEDRDWKIKYHAKIVGLNTSYHLKIQYKGKHSIRDIEFNIHPYYAMGTPSLDKDGSFVWKCDGECRYIEKERELLSFISWKEDKVRDEKMRFILLKKIY